MSDRPRPKNNLVTFIETARILFETGGLRGLAMLPFACGYVIVDGRRLPYHDHTTESYYGDANGPHIWNVNIGENVPYDPKVHGEIHKFVAEGGRVPDERNSTEDRAPIHRHSSKARMGPYEFRYE